MSKYLFGDLVREVKEKVDRQNNPYEFFIAGDHMDTDELHLLRWGTFAGSDVGPAFIRIFKPGQVLYGSRRTYLRKVAVADFEGVTANTTFVLETKDESILHQRLLPFIMQSERFVQHSIKRSKGSTNPYVLFSDLCNYEVDLPDIETQKRLAEILWAIDEVKMAYKRLIAATDELVKSQFIEMFGDPLKNPRHLPQFRLEKFIHFLTSGSRGWAKYYSEYGEWFITITNVKNCKVSIDNIQCICPPHNAEAERTRVKEGDLLISVTADLGRTGVITKEIADHGAYINQHLTCIRLEQSALDPTYVAYFMETEAGKKQFFEKNLSSVKAGLNFDSIRSLRLLVPPLEQQKEFVNFLQQSDKSKFAVLNCLKRNLLLILQKTEDVHSLINQSAKKYFCKSCHRENHNG